MKRSDQSRAVWVRRYAIRQLNNWGEDCEEELRRANQFWNKLVEIDLAANEAFNKATSDNPQVIEYQENVDFLRQQREDLVTERMRQRKESRSRKVDPIIMTRLRENSILLKTTNDKLKKAKRQAREQIKEKLQELDTYRREQIKRARQDSGVYWGTAGILQDKFETARQAVLTRRTRGQKAEMQFRRFQGDGLFNVHFSDGLPTSEFGIKSSRGRAAVLQNNNLTITAFSERSGEPREITRNRTIKLPNGTLKTLNETLVTRGIGTPRSLSMDLVLHRSLPELSADADLRIKDIQVVLRKNPNYHQFMKSHKQWDVRRSAAVITMTAKESEFIDIEPTAGAVAVNLGWRLLSDGSLRIATIVGQKWPTEYVILPRARLRLAEIIEEMRSQRDLVLATMLPRLRGLPWDTAPPAIRIFGQALAKAPKLGPRSLARLVIEWKALDCHWCEDDLTVFEEWRKNDNVWLYRGEKAKRKFFGERKYRYQLAAKRIAERASVILLDEVDFSELARIPKDRDPKFEMAIRRNRQLAAVSELTLEIKHQAAKYRREIIFQKGPSTFVECHICGKPLDVPQNHKMDLTYFHDYCRATLDQDDNNCRIRLKRWLEAAD